MLGELGRARRRLLVALERGDAGQPVTGELPAVDDHPAPSQEGGDVVTTRSQELLVAASREHDTRERCEVGRGQVVELDEGHRHRVERSVAPGDPVGAQPAAVRLRPVAAGDVTVDGDGDLVQPEIARHQRPDPVVALD